MNTLKQVNRDDEMMATLEAQGGVVASVQKRNFASVDDVVRFVMSLAGKFAWLGKLTIRNKTQGWRVVMSLAVRRPSISIAGLGASVSAPASAQPHDGAQYLIPW
ncbi:MAG: hypothetical protein IIT60_06665 [Muribaculaceae bacterium]|nr:hypothetical protein [Muribaculaceae bacterium]